MAKQEKVLESLKNFGVSPLENRCIVVQFYPTNLSAKVANFVIADAPVYVLQICEKELVLASFKWTGSLKKEVPLKIEISDIKQIDIEEKGFNYKISIICDDENIILTTQQKELAVFRKSGVFSVENFWGTKNWHSENLDATLKELQNISQDKSN